MKKELIVSYNHLSKKKFYTQAKKYIDQGYKIKEVTKETGSYISAVYIYTGQINPETYITNYYLEHLGKNKEYLEAKFKEGYVLCHDEWYDMDETNVYMLVKEKEIFADNVTR